MHGSYHKISTFKYYRILKNLNNNTYSNTSVINLPTVFNKTILISHYCSINTLISN